METRRWRIRLLGGLEARTGGEAPGGERIVTHFETRRISALLAYLALNLHRAHPREVVAERLWPEEDWDATRNRLRQALSSLRHDLEPDGAPEGSILITGRAEVCLDPAAVTTDVEEFETGLRAAERAQDPAGRARRLRAAIELYRGELLPGFYEEWVLIARERLAETYRNALGRLAGVLAETGDYTGAIEVARRFVAEDPLREDAHCDLMRYYEAAGRASEAIRQYRDLERRLREELGAVPCHTSRSLLEQLRAGPPVSSAPAAPAAGRASPAPAAARAARPLEPEGGAVPLDSPFYITRPTDAQFAAALARQDSIVLVKGPRQVGKTSLLARGLQAARERAGRVVLTDLQKLPPEQMETTAALFRAFAEMIADQLDLNISLDEVWNPQRGWNVNFERFLRREALARSETPLIWGLDEVDRLFSYPFSSVVFGLFRSWHNERSLNPQGPWGRLTLAIAYATEAHLFITDLNQSPFNVGTRLTMEDFTRGEVAELNRRYGAPLPDAEAVDRFYALVGGHPYLVRRGLHAMAESGLQVGALEAQATSGEAIFGDHLGRMLAGLAQDSELCEAVLAVLRGEPCPNAASFYRLRSAGVLVGNSAAEARPRCRLYAEWLGQHL